MTSPKPKSKTSAAKAAPADDKLPALRPGMRVIVVGGSGLDSGREGVILSPAEGSALVNKLYKEIGYYKPFDPSREVAIRDDTGAVFGMFKNRVLPVDHPRGIAEVNFRKPAVASEEAASVDLSLANGPMGYPEILEALKGAFGKGSPIAESLSDELAGGQADCNFEEIEHESRDGFIPYTDGGLELRVRTDLADLNSSGLSRMTNDATWALIEKLHKGCMESALGSLQGDEATWAEVLRITGNDESWDPNDLTDVMDALYDVSQGEDSDLADAAESLRGEINQNYENGGVMDGGDIDFYLRGQVYLPGNERNALQDGRSEVLLRALTEVGETYWIRTSPERDHVNGPEVSIPVEPTDTVATLQAKVAKEAEALAAWLKGEPIPLAGDRDYTLPEGAVGIFYVPGSKTACHLYRTSEGVSASFYQERGVNASELDRTDCRNLDASKAIEYARKHAGIYPEALKPRGAALKHTNYALPVEGSIWVHLDQFAVKLHTDRETQKPGATRLLAEVFIRGLESSEAPQRIQVEV